MRLLNDSLKIEIELFGPLVVCNTIMQYIVKAKTIKILVKRGVILCLFLLFFEILGLKCHLSSNMSFKLRFKETNWLTKSFLAELTNLNIFAS